MTLCHVIVVALIMLVASSSASAQDQTHASFVPAVAKSVILDPTTYAPAIVAWNATRLDWQSSQIFFRNGFVEHNPHFTASGLDDDTPIGYGAGNRQILMDSIANLQLSLINNVSERVMERLLISRHPNQGKLLRTIGWIERSAMASYWAYRLSAVHLHQWQENRRRAQQFGYDLQE